MEAACERVRARVFVAAGELDRSVGRELEVLIVLVRRSGGVGPGKAYRSAVAPLPNLEIRCISRFRSVSTCSSTSTSLEYSNVLVDVVG